MNTNSLCACLAVSLLCAFPAAHAQPRPAEWIADSKGCKVANPQPQQLESIRWSGGCKDGMAHGPGMVSWFSEGKSNGITSGTFMEGKLMGKGYVTMPHAVYKEVKVAKRMVKVRRFWPAGSRLDGEFFENELVGVGTLTAPNGDKTLVRQTDGRLHRR